MWNRYLKILLLVLLAGLKATAQDPHFSQFNASPMTLNPALTGFFNGDYRICANYRSQWASFAPNGFRTVAASFEMSVFKGRLKDDNLAFGASFYNDAAGSAGFGRNRAMFSAAYKKMIGGAYRRTKHTLTAGVSLGFMEDKVDASKLTFDNQFNGIVFDPNIPSGVVVKGSNLAFDLDAGVLYQIIPNPHQNYYFGLSVTHITGPRLNMLQGSSYGIPQRYTFHFGAKVEINNYLNILPSVLYQQEGAAREELAGGYVQFVFDYLNDAETAFAIGTWARVSEITADAMIVGARLDFQHFAVGASYDVNISNLSSVSKSRGAYEASIVYTGGFVTRGKRKLTIPCPQL